MSYLVITTVLFTLGTQSALAIDHYFSTSQYKKLNENAPKSLNNTKSGEVTLSPFFTDGCSALKEGLLSMPGLVQLCCIEHDFRYWLGGTRAERLDADRQLRSCIGEVPMTGAIAQIIYSTVRMFGKPGTGRSYQWGYGWKNPDGSLADIGYNRPSIVGFCEEVQAEYERKESFLPYYVSQPKRPAPQCD